MFNITVFYWLWLIRLEPIADSCLLVFLERNGTVAFENPLNQLNRPKFLINNNHRPWNTHSFVSAMTFLRGDSSSFFHLIFECFLFIKQSHLWCNARITFSSTDLVYPNWLRININYLFPEEISKCCSKFHYSSYILNLTTHISVSIPTVLWVLGKKELNRHFAILSVSINIESSYGLLGSTIIFVFLFVCHRQLFVYETFGTVNRLTNILLLMVVGLLVNGPYALITTAVSTELGTHQSLRGSSKALATVTAIIDGTGSIGAFAAELHHVVWSRFELNRACSISILWSQAVATRVLILSV